MSELLERGTRGVLLGRLGPRGAALPASFNRSHAACMGVRTCDAGRAVPSGWIKRHTIDGDQEVSAILTDRYHIASHSGNSEGPVDFDSSF